MKTRTLTIAIGLLVLSASGIASAAAAHDLAPTMVVLPANHHATVSLAIRFRAGAVDDPPGKAGLTYLTAMIMAEGGTRSLDARQLLETLFPMAADVNARVDKELTTFSTTVHRDHLATMLPIFADVVAHPRWDEKEFLRLRDAAVNDVEKRLREGDDENLGKEALSELLYRGHPYGRLTIGHAGDLRSMTLADVKAQAARVFTRDRMTIGVAGGYPKNLPTELANALVDLPAHGAPPVAIPVKAPGRPRFLLVDKQTDSTAVSMGFPWQLSRSNADFVAMTIARSAFGEHRQFNGRLMQRLRGARGLNYGDYAYLEHFEQEGYDAATAQTGRVRHQQDFTIWLRPVQNENRLFALRAALYELARSVSSEPFTDAEVDSTKGFLEGYLLLFAQTDARRLGYAMDDRFLGMHDFLGGWRAKLASVTTAQVNAAWKKWVKPGEVQVVLVTPGATQVKQQILANTPSPMHYQRDAQGQVPEKPADLLRSDAVIEKLPLDARGPSDVEVVPVAQMFR